MTDPTLDQIAAAQADARNMMKTTLGSDGPTSGTSTIIERYLVRLPLGNGSKGVGVELEAVRQPGTALQDLILCIGGRR
ncbi:hypothetical protein [Streptomyces sp. NPDC060205]|uniref:hypothetical protein n=1 Tax=Streptomyces sp. NPDC060205 TaxID=3347072 RepID=UPI003652F2E4